VTAPAARGYKPGMTAPSAVPVANLNTDASRNADVYCLGCGYNLRGLEGEGAAADARCPECGRPFDALEYAGVRAPWVERHRVGHFAAYWHTVLLVTFRPLEFAGRFRWPQVRFHGSAQFRRLTVAWASGAAVLAAAALAWHLRVPPVGFLIVLGAVAPSAALFFYCATEFKGYFTGPRLPTDTSEEGFRARIVNDYASAALAWLAVPAGVVCFAVVLEKLYPGPMTEWVFTAAVALLAWVLVLWATDVLVLFGAALALGRGAMVLTGVFFPLRFAGMALMIALFIFAPLACAVGGLVSMRP
jgi:hypothetical protein